MEMLTDLHQTRKITPPILEIMNLDQENLLPRKQLDSTQRFLTQNILFS